MARQSANGVQLALRDQIRALDMLAGVAREQRLARDAMPPDGQPVGARRPLSGNLTDPMPLAPGQLYLPSGQGSGREGWTLGDLLARASREEADATATGLPGQDASGNRTSGSPGGRPGPPALDLATIAAAVDPLVAADVWNRLRRGERNVLNRQMYTPEGQATFDQVATRLRSDPAFRGMIDRYLTDFERVLQQAAQRDPTGRSTLAQVQAETGRVYLLLTHASGRLT
jgi:hypothetical protein